MDKEQYIKQAALAHHNKYNYSELFYSSLDDKITVKCNKHGSFTVKAKDHLFAKKACAKCKNKRAESVWLDSIGIEKKFTTVKINDISYYVDGIKDNVVYLYLNDEFDGKNNENFIFTEDKINKLSSKYKVTYIWESDFLKSSDAVSQIIILDNKYAKFICADQKIFNKLKLYLSFKAEGVEYTAAYKNGWNGITYLIDNDGVFASGLLDKVKDFCKKHYIAFNIIDKRIIETKSNPLDLSPVLLKHGFEVRDYQQRAVDAAYATNKGIIRAATGSGKTLISSLLTAKLNKPTILYVIGLDLLKQFHELYSLLFDEKIGFIGNGICDIQRINIASIWSISSALRGKADVFNDDEISDKELPPSLQQTKDIINMLKATKVHIFDESHVATTETIKSIFNIIDPQHIYGLSGTPFRDDGSDMLVNGILGEQIVEISASELIKKEFLAQPLIKFVRVPKTYENNGNTYQSVYKDYIVENNIRNNLIVKSVTDLTNLKYQVLVLFKTIQHGKNISSMLSAAGIEHEYLSGQDSLEKRVAVKKNLLSKTSNVLVASTIADIGVDIPSLSALVLGGGGKSSIRALQRIGRVIRKYPGKKCAAIVDFYDDVKYLKIHSKKRYKIYKNEPGFVLMKNNIKELS